MITTIQFKKIEGEFPKYEQILPQGEPIAETYMNAELLAEVLEAFKSECGANRVKIQFFGDKKPLIIKGDLSDTSNKTALIMPLNK